MKRKLMAGALALTMVASLVACGGEKKAASEGDSKEAVTPSLTVLKYKIPFKPRVLAALEGIYISF